MARKEPPSKRPPARPDLKILEAQVFRGPNYYSYDPSIRLLMDLGSLEQWPSNSLRGFNVALLEMLPGLKDHTCSVGRRGGFLERLEEGRGVGHSEEQVGLAAGKLAVRLMNHLVKADPEFDFLVELEKLIRLAERRAFGPSTQAIIDEAAARDIPYMRLNEQSLVQLGQGAYQKRIRATMTSSTPALAVDIAGDKKLTNQLLAAAGAPPPRGGG